MVRSLLKIDEKKMAIIENVRHLTENERFLLQDFLDVMEPFEGVTNQIQREKVAIKLSNPSNPRHKAHFVFPFRIQQRL